MKKGENGTVLVQGKFAIYSLFLDRTFQVEVKMLDGESIKDAVKRVNKELEETAAELKKEAESMRGEIISETIQGAKQTSPPIGPPMPDAIIRSKQPEEKRILFLMADINSCESIKALESYRLMVRNNIQLQAAYDEKYVKLSAV
jgi:hypothetical protein